MKKLIFTGIASLAFSTQATAQDFGGVRVEGRLGYQSVNLEADFDDDDEALSGDESEGGLTYGAEVGFDLQATPGILVGAYAGYSLSNVKRCAEVFGADEGCLEAGRTITLGVRAGAPVSAAALVYAKAGYSNTKIKVRYEGVGNLINDFKLSESGGGFHAGGGVELALGTNLYVKGEYVFTKSSGNFEDFGTSAELNADRHEFIAGVGFRF